MEEELVFVGWWCWKADGHFSDIACRSDCVPLYVPTEWESHMKKMIAGEDGDCDRCGGTGVDPERYVTVQGANAVYDLPSPCTGCTQSGGDR
jgi:hypothetical protein